MFYTIDVYDDYPKNLNSQSQNYVHDQFMILINIIYISIYIATHYVSVVSSLDATITTPESFGFGLSSSLKLLSSSDVSLSSPISPIS